MLKPRRSQSMTLSMAARHVSEDFSFVWSATRGGGARELRARGSLHHHYHTTLLIFNILCLAGIFSESVASRIMEGCAKFKSAWLALRDRLSNFSKYNLVVRRPATVSQLM